MKKKAAKFFALTLAASMIVTSGVTALAAETLTLSGDQGDQTYESATTFKASSAEDSVSFDTLTLIDDASFTDYWTLNYWFTNGTYTMKNLSAAYAGIWVQSTFSVTGDASLGELCNFADVSIGGSLSLSGRKYDSNGTTSVSSMTQLSMSELSVDGDYSSSANSNYINISSSNATIGGSFIMTGSNNHINATGAQAPASLTVNGDVILTGGDSGSVNSGLTLNADSSVIIYGDLILDSADTDNSNDLTLNDNASLIIYGDAYYSDGTELNPSAISDSATFIVYGRTADTEEIVTVVEEDTTMDDFIAAIISIEEEIAAEQSTSGTVTIQMTALPNSIMQALVTNSNVTLVVEFTYNDVAYTITIPAGAAVDNEIPWYGPLYLIGMYGSNSTVKTSAASGSTYTVQSGDSLSLIAADHNMTLSELAALNPQITNINLIYAGDVINIG